MVFQLAVGGFLLGAPLVIETTSPDALCPDLASAQQAVADRLGSSAAAEGWRASYVVVRTPGGDGDHLVVELRDPQNRLHLRRELPLSPGACSTMAVAIAVVLERFFADLTTEARPLEEPEAPGSGPATAEHAKPPTDIEPRPRNTSHDAPAEPGLDSSSTPVATADSTSAPPPHWQWWMGPLLGVVATDGANDLRPEAGLFVRAVTPWHLQLGALGSASWEPRRDATSIEGEEVIWRSYSFTCRAFGHYWLGGDRWRVTLGPELALAVESASARPSTDSRWRERLLPSAGFGGTVALSLGNAWAAGLIGSMDFTLPDRMSKFTYSWNAPGNQEETTQEVLRVHAGRGLFGVFVQVAPWGSGP